MTPFGALLRELRLAAGMTQELLAERATLSVRAVSDLERGVNRSARRETAELLASALEVDESARMAFVLTAMGRSTPPTAEPNALVGRDAEQQAVASALAGEAMVVTIVGPGGIGKTSLARAVHRESPAAVWVDLAPLVNADLVVPTVATAIGVPSESKPTPATIAGRLHNHPILVVLDNAEHVHLPVTELVVAVSAVASAARVLVTSRIPLHTAAEQVIVLGPLPSDAEAGQLSPAATLFTRRAAEAVPGWQPDEGDLPMVTELCSRLDGLPLAIELAAARIRLLSVGDLLQRLDLDTLSGRRADTPDRQRTMRSTIGWSHGLLAPAEQEVFAAIGAFRGSWTVPALEHVVGRHVLDDLETLLDASLVVAQQSDHDPRFAASEAVAEFAREQLAQSPTAALVHQRHVGWCAELAALAGTGLTGAEQGDWMTRLDAEQDNLRAALTWAIERSIADDAERLSAGVWRYWYIRGQLHEGRSWLDRVLALGADDGGSVERGRARYGASIMAWMQGDNATALDQAARAFAILSTAGDQVAASHVVNLQGMISQYRGELEQASSRFNEALEIGRRIGDARVMAVSLINIGNLSVARGDEAAAESALRDSLVHFRALGDERSSTDALGNLGELAIRQGRLDEAADLLGECLDVFVRLGDRPGESESRQALARLCILRGEYAEAEAEWRSVLALSELQGDPWGEATAWTGLAETAASRQDASARALFERALGLHRSLEHEAGVIRALDGLVAEAERTGDSQSAARWREEREGVGQGARTDVSGQ